MRSRNSMAGRRPLSRSVSKPRLVIFCKAPIPGEVKTRLIATEGIASATRIHEELATRLILECLASDLLREVNIELWCSPTTEHKFYDQFDVPRFLQQGADLGERMLNAFDFSETATQLIGTDCPNLTAEYIQSSFYQLATHDAVLGPAEDGGYGLIGLQVPEPSVFKDIQWGTGQVCSDTCRRLDKLEMNWALLPQLWDVDRPEDVQRWRGNPPANSF